jgi:hypothetical protein
MTKEMFPDPKFDALVAGLKAVEEKYKDFFESRESHRFGQTHDVIDNHWIMVGNTLGGGTFSVRNDSDLPDHIRKECYDVFYRVYEVEDPRKN